jgi:hypothetical protein
MLTILLPEVANHWLVPAAAPVNRCWKDAIAMLLPRLSKHSFSASLAGLFLPVRAVMKEGLTDPLTLAAANAIVAGVASRWRLSTNERSGAAFALAHFTDILRAKDLAWSRLQPILVENHVVHAVELAEAWSYQTPSPDLASVDFCRAWLQRSREELDPPPLLTGDDLQKLGFAPSPVFREVLKQVRSQQLDGLIANRAQALAIVDRLLRNQ